MGIVFLYKKERFEAMLKVIGIVLLCLLALIALILALPVVIELKKSQNIGFKISARVFCFEKNLTPALEKKAMKKEDGKTGEQKKQKKNRQKKQKKNKQGQKLSPTEIISLSFFAVRELFRLFGRCHVKKLHIEYVAAGDDPAETAMTYGGVSAALYPFLAFINAKMKVKKSAEKINIACDFEKQQAEFDFDIALQLRPFWAAVAFVRLVAAFIKRKRSA